MLSKLKKNIAVFFHNRLYFHTLPKLVSDENLKNAVLETFHFIFINIPAVKVADDGDAPGAGRPGAKQAALSAGLVLGGVGAEATPGPGRASGGKRLQFLKKVVSGEIFPDFGHIITLKVGKRWACRRNAKFRDGMSPWYSYKLYNFHWGASSKI